MRDALQHDGFLILENFVSAVTCTELIQRAEELVAAFEPEEIATIFSTTTQSHKADDYFQTSGIKSGSFSKSMRSMPTAD